MSEVFLLQTALDYDMDIADVRHIANLYPNEFYEKLEDFIKNRSNN
jgi:hypothetical protein